MRVPFFPHSCQHLFFVFFLMIAILTVWGDISLWFWFLFPWWLMMLSIFSCACWPFVYLPGKNVYLGFCPFSFFSGKNYIFLLIDTVSSLGATLVMIRSPPLKNIASEQAETEPVWTQVPNQGFWNNKKSKNQPFSSLTKGVTQRVQSSAFQTRKPGAQCRTGNQNVSEMKHSASSNTQGLIIPPLLQEVVPLRHF